MTMVPTKRCAQPLTESQYAAALAQLSRVSQGAWRNASRPGSVVSWRVFSRSDVNLSSEGWKLHVSCATADVVDMIGKLAPILFERRSPFKIPARLRDVATINFGLAGETQIGKILTIYPCEDDFAYLGRELTEKWQNTDGPWILTDVPVQHPRRVFARWGAFSEHLRVDRFGISSHQIRGPDGRYVQDERRGDGRQPSWAPAPPLVLDDAARPPILKDPQPSVGGRTYLPLGYLPSRAGSAVALVLDVGSLDTAILKTVRRGAQSDANGFDSFDRLKNEYQVLRELRQLGIDGVPIAIAIDAKGGELLSSVQSNLDGPNLSQVAGAERVACLPLLTEAVAQLNNAGFVHRDVKLANAVRVIDKVALIDFEFTAPVGSREHIPGGTPGYVGPEGAGPVAEVSQDSYALGVTIFEAITGISPAVVPPNERGGRMTGILAQQGLTAAADLVHQFTLTDPKQRPAPSDAAGHGSLAQCWREVLSSASAKPPQQISRRHRNKWLRCAFEVARDAERFARRQEHGSTWQFIDDHGPSLGESLYGGAAGAAVALRVLGAQLGYSAFSDQAYEGGLWLASRAPLSHAHGMFTGNAGVGVTLALLGRDRNDPTLLDGASDRLRAAATADFKDPDLFSGCAGIVWAGVLIAQLLQAPWPLEAVRGHADALIENVSRDPQSGICCWPSCEDHDPGGTPYFGVAHGSAGIALALAMWGAATRDARSCELAHETLRSLYDGLIDGIVLRQQPSGALTSPTMWCHGTCGVLWALLRVDEVIPDVTDLLSTLGERFVQESLLPPSVDMCHGIAGVLDVVTGLRNREIGGQRANTRMQQLADVLVHLATRDGDRRTWFMPGTDMATPGLVRGFLGTAATLAAAATPRMGGVLSRHWFQPITRVQR